MRQWLPYSGKRSRDGALEAWDPIAGCDPRAPDGVVRVGGAGGGRGRRAEGRQAGTVGLGVLGSPGAAACRRLL
ncbi:hypothetical protein GCM10010294_28150 [Streptomyces griseoloalbus]|nr:hypothetical protein GCM10010294_28150 [Streptomyces griseoloalbus]